jgi:hypothetical protein
MHRLCKRKHQARVFAIKCRVYCSAECQHKSRSDHKNKYKLLTPQGGGTVAVLREDVENGYRENQHHGEHFHVTEKFQYAGDESNRDIPLASVNHLTLDGMPFIVSYM